jgi:hypothetical protein
MRSYFDLTIGQLIGGQAAINSVVGIVIIARAIRASFILLLSASALGKAMDMQGFAVIVASYQVLPESLLLIAASAIVLVEVSLAVWLALGFLPRFQNTLAPAAIGVLGLHWMYFAWMLIALLRGLTIPNCGCFGVYFGRPLTWFTLIEDALLICLAWVMWRSGYRASRTN